MKKTTTTSKPAQTTEATQQPVKVRIGDGFQPWPVKVRIGDGFQPW